MTLNSGNFTQKTKPIHDCDHTCMKRNHMHIISDTYVRLSLSPWHILAAGCFFSVFCSPSLNFIMLLLLQLFVRFLLTRTWHIWLTDLITIASSNWIYVSRWSSLIHSKYMRVHWNSLWLFRFVMIVPIPCYIGLLCLLLLFRTLLRIAVVHKFNWYISKILLSHTYTQTSAVNLVSKLYITFNLICFSKLGICTCTMCNNGFTVNDVKLVESREGEIVCVWSLFKRTVMVALLLAKIENSCCYTSLKISFAVNYSVK